MTIEKKSLPEETGIATRLFPKGRLKIFLGAVPGVGKTFAMLQAAAERKGEGVDVVVGLVETHKRKETELQLANLEILPRKVVSYRGRSFEELDLDGILARAPELVLIDECAHSNLPGSRHPKRYNDIEEILEHGIDVYTTLNIQHLESLKDIVGEITHVKIRETIPNFFIQSAYEVQLIDLPPDDLLQRLADGKIYIPDQVKAASEHFFKRSNLLALRELALRHTITVADDEMAHYMQQQGLKGPSPASDKVMVCIDTHPSGLHLVRTASRVAERLQAKWLAVTVETPEDENRSLIAQQQLSQTLHLAEELGAKVIALDGINVADTLVQYALANNVTDMIVGQPQHPNFWEKLPFIGHRPIVEQILSHWPPLTLRIIPTEKKDLPLNQFRSTSFLNRVLPYLVTLALTLGIAMGIREMNHYTSFTNVETFFLLNIVYIAYKFGLGPAFLSTLISSGVYKFYFIEPKYHWTISTLEGILSLISFIFGALVLSNLTIQVRNIFSLSQGRLRQIRFFSQFTQKLLQCSGKNEVLHHLCQQLHLFLNLSVIAFWDIQENLVPTVQYLKTKPIELTESDANAIQWALAHQIRSGRSTENFSDAHYLYLPIKIGNNSFGVVGIWAIKDQLTIDDFRVAQTLIDQAALTIERFDSGLVKA